MIETDDKANRANISNVCMSELVVLFTCNLRKPQETQQDLGRNRDVWM